MKHNYKTLENQYHKAQERIQSLLKEIKCQESTNCPSALYSCDQCTKNFLSFDSLKSHQQRKHTAISEKHELSDDNEKQNDYINRISFVQEANLNKVDVISSAKEVLQSNANNKSYEIDNISNNNCTICSQKMKINSTSIATQYEESIHLKTSSEIHDGFHDHEKTNINTKRNTMKSNERDFESNKTEKNVKTLETESIQRAYETISELKKEIIDLKNSLEAKTSVEDHHIISEHAVSSQLTNLEETNDKIDIIEQKFNAFEIMYTESQHQFIESFRNLDERQKIYMDNIQGTIKEIVEKSLKVDTAAANTNNETNYQNNSESETEQAEVKSANQKFDGANEKVKSSFMNSEQEDCVQIPHEEYEQSVIHDTTSYTEDGTKLLFQAEIHAISQNESKENDQHNVETVREKTKLSQKQTNEGIIIYGFERRLRQFGVEANSTSLSTPRFCRINEKLIEGREEMKEVSL